MMRIIKKAQVKRAAAWLLFAIAWLGVIANWIDGEPRGYPLVLVLAAGWLSASARAGILEGALMSPRMQGS